MKILIIIFFVLWELFQNLLGFIVLVVLFLSGNIHDIIKHRGRLFIKTFSKFGLSLGFFLFCPLTGDPSVVSHEYGHSIQSRLFGPLYLLVIGFPSFILACLSFFNKKIAAQYFNLWPEKWADKLGGVRRD